MWKVYDGEINLLRPVKQILQFWSKNPGNNISREKSGNYTLAYSATEVESSMNFIEWYFLDNLLYIIQTTTCCKRNKLRVNVFLDDFIVINSAKLLTKQKKESFYVLKPAELKIMTFADHETCYFFHSEFARSPYLLIFSNSYCCRQVTLVEVVPGTDVTIIIQAQSSAWRWNIGITQVSQV